MGQVKQGQFSGRACEGLSTAPLTAGPPFLPRLWAAGLNVCCGTGWGKDGNGLVNMPTTHSSQWDSDGFWFLFFFCLEGTLPGLLSAFGYFPEFETVDSGRLCTVFSLALWVRQFSEVLPLMFSLTFLFLLWILKVVSCSTNFYFGSCFPSRLKICHKLCSGFHCFHWEVSHQSYCLSFAAGVTFLCGPFTDLFPVCFGGSLR